MPLSSGWPGHSQLSPVMRRSPKIDWEGRKG
jgi:hypothetical protein